MDHEPGARPHPRLRRVRAPLQPRPVRPRCLGAHRQGRRDEVHRDHVEASRRVRHLRLEDLALRHRRCHAVQAGRAQGIGPGGAPRRHALRGLLLDHGLAPPRRQGPNAPEYNSSTWSNANFGRYVENYMKPQIKELLTQYPEIDVLWFDGEWIADWNDERGRDLYAFVRGIRPTLIVNNRVGHTRQGLSGLNQAGQIGLGDFGTPEQQAPPEGLPGVDWETCMTMNDTWGYKSYDDDWKDTRTLLRTW